MLFLEGQVLVARALLREGDRRLVDRLPVDVAVAEGVAPEERVGGRETVVDPSLREVLVGRLRAREQILAHAARQPAAVRKRKERVEIGGKGRVKLDGSPRQDAMAGVPVRDKRDSGDAEALDQRFVGREEESPVAPERATQRRAELVAFEGRDRLVAGIEKVLGVERRIAQELEGRAVHGVGPGAGDGVDHAAGGAAELGRVGVGQHLELEHRLDAEQDAGDRAGRLVVDVVDVGPVEQEVVLFGARPVDRDLGRAAPDDVVSGGQRRPDARLQERELLERAAVEREVPDLAIVDQSGDRSRGQVDLGGIGRNAHLARRAPQLELHVHDGVLADRQHDPLARHGLESRGRDVQLVLARRKHREPEAPQLVAHLRLGRAGPDVAQLERGSCHDGATRIEETSLQACTDGLGAARRAAEEDQSCKPEPSADTALRHGGILLAFRGSAEPFPSSPSLRARGGRLPRRAGGACDRSSP